MNSPGHFTLIHFNDVYNVEPRPSEPKAGAARFKSAIRSFQHLDPMVLFSGDCFAPSIMSTFTKGEQMIPVLNECGVHCAVFGNHDFDFGVDNLVSFTKRTTFPWLMSNVIDNETNRPLADGKLTHVIEKNGKKFGFLGLVEEEWLATLVTINREDVIFLDYVSEGRKLARQLKEKENVDFVIALTHMRFPNDCRLAEYVDEIDLILGGHDHVYEVRKINEKFVVKSGTDFIQFSKIDLLFNGTKVDISINEINVTSTEFSEDEHLKQQLEKFSLAIEGKMDTVLGQFACDLDGRFTSIRSEETNLGNFICDIMLACTHSDLAILNSGSYRSDRIHPRGDFTLRDLVTIIPMMDPLVVLKASGELVWKTLENGVSQWPKLEGRFPQVSGVKFAFDPSKPPGERIDPNLIKIGDEYMTLDFKYRLVTTVYLHKGKDGYDVLKDCEVIISEEECPALCTAVQNHFDAIKMLKGTSEFQTHHRQSLVTLSRRSSIVKSHESLDGIGSPKEQKSPRAIQRQISSPIGPNIPALPVPQPVSPFKPHVSPSATKRAFRNRSPMDAIEFEQCKLEPKVEGRILNLTQQVTNNSSDAQITSSSK